MINLSSNQAHFITDDSRYRVKSGIKGLSTRYLVFTIGRSRKHHYLKDETFNDEALMLLQKVCDKRLAIKGVTSPNGYISYLKLTHFGVYHRWTSQVFNPKTGELGFYELRTGN